MIFRKELFFEFSQSVKATRESKNLSSRQVDALCGWKAPTTAGVEKMKKPKESRLLTICEVLELDTNKYFHEKEI